MKRLVIIEDDKVLSRIYAAKFSAEGYNVATAPDGETGLAVIECGTADVVLLDLMLPGISGLEVLRRVRASARFAQLPIIVFANLYLDSQAEEVAQAGATRCLPKATTSPRQVIEAVNAAVSAPPPPALADQESPAQVREEFLASLTARIAELRPFQQVIVTADVKSERMPALLELQRRMDALSGNAVAAAIPLLAQVAGAFAALLKELCDKPNQINVSTVRTVTQTVNFLGQLAGNAGQLPSAPLQDTRILAVDDDPICLRAVLTALGKADLRAESFQDPLKAFTAAESGKFELIILDIDMPGMRGFELCRRLRGLQAYQHTPVIFVTSLHDFQSRAKGALSGADDLIAKPILLLELAVKALTYLVKPLVPRT